jgi:hypothetical protein
LISFSFPNLPFVHSRSSGPRVRVGSILTSGTTIGGGFSDFVETFFVRKSASVTVL